VTYGVFRPDENKTVLPAELDRVREHPKGGCILVSRMNTLALVGASVYVPCDRPDLVLPDRIWQLEPDTHRVDGLWLYYVLSAPGMRARLSELASGTSGSMKNLSQEKFLGLCVSIPPLGEQRKIAAILSSVDDAIDATQAVIEQLQVVKKAMMAELLSRGLPGRHTRFKQTEIGEVPEEWEVVKLGSTGDWLSGGTPSKQDPTLWDGPVPWVSPKDMKRPRIDDAIDHVSREALRRGTQRRFRIPRVRLAAGVIAAA
jgi:type I restriction enzyme S subunit